MYETRPLSAHERYNDLRASVEVFINPGTPRPPLPIAIRKVTETNLLPKITNRLALGAIKDIDAAALERHISSKSHPTEFVFVKEQSERRNSMSPDSFGGYKIPVNPGRQHLSSNQQHPQSSELLGTLCAAGADGLTPQQSAIQTHVTRTELQRSAVPWLERR